MTEPRWPCLCGGRSHEAAPHASTSGSRAPFPLLTPPPSCRTSVQPQALSHQEPGPCRAPSSWPPTPPTWSGPETPARPLGPGPQLAPSGPGWPPPGGPARMSAWTTGWSASPPSSPSSTARTPSGSERALPAPLPPGGPVTCSSSLPVPPTPSPAGSSRESGGIRRDLLVRDPRHTATLLAKPHPGKPPAQSPPPSLLPSAPASPSACSPTLLATLCSHGRWERSCRPPGSVSLLGPGWAGPGRGVGSTRLRPPAPCPLSDCPPGAHPGCRYPVTAPSRR